MNGKEVRDLVNKHLMEAQAGTVDCTVSELIRGQATARRYFLMKIDLVGSTVALKRASSEAYLKLAHSYLSTVDRITQEYGAQPDQNEYAGDSVIAFFPEYGNSAVATLTAACFSHYAARVLGESDFQMAQLGLKTRTVLHYGELLVAKIGPYGESHTVAIGLPMHEVGHREKSPSVPADGIYVTEEFAAQLPSKARTAYLRPVWPAGQPASARPTPPIASLGLGAARISPDRLESYNGTLSSLMSTYSTPPQAGLFSSLSGFEPTIGSLSAIVPQRTPQQRLADLLYKQSQSPRDGFTVDMLTVYKELGL